MAANSNKPLRHRHPAFLLPASFAVLIIIGTGIIMLPGMTTEKPLTLLEALFTMTSAVCVTGLIVRDTATQFTPLGQTVIAVFIQLGGLGIIIFGSVGAMLLGRRLTLADNIQLSEILNEMPIARVRRMVWFIVIVTFGIELIGAAAMYPLWTEADAPDVASRIGMSLFHSISAFCNAGFAMKTDSLVVYRYSLLTHVVVAGLLVVGGIGFPVLENLYRVAAWRCRALWMKLRRRPFLYPQPLRETRLSLHARLVLATTLGIYLFGVVWIFAAQTKPAFSGMLQQGQTAGQQRESLSVTRLCRTMADAHYQSLTARTAGFNSMPMAELGTASQFTLIVLMCVGGSPGGTAGGLKTTTLAVLLLSVTASIRQRTETEAYQRRIADPLVRRAAALVATFFAVLTVAVLLLGISEPFAFMPILFEAVSAITTTGLSLGITDQLSAFGQVVIILLMYLGRVGPLALMGALVVKRRSHARYLYPHEDVMLG